MMASKQRQMTIRVDGEKIKIVSKARTYCRHFNGYEVQIDDGKNFGDYRIMQPVSFQRAMDEAYVAFIKEFK